MSRCREGLVCRGVIRRSIGDESTATAFVPARCAGCSGRCGIRIGRMRLTIPQEIADGTPVEFTASPGALTGRALFIFGSPLVLAALPALFDAPPWLVPVAFLGGLLLALGARTARPSIEPDVQVQTDRRPVRVQLR